jgi:hypothetical protein
MLHILTKVKIVIMSIIDSIRISNANSNESEIILIHFTNNQIIKACYKHICIIINYIDDITTNYIDILFIFYDDIKNIYIFIHL